MQRSSLKFLRAGLVACTTILSSGCLAGTFDRNAYSSSDDDELIREIMLKHVGPQNRKIYAASAQELAEYDIDWEDVAGFNSSCQFNNMRRNASRTDLEIIHFIWVKSSGRRNRATKLVKSTLGESSYRSALEISAGGAFDCLLETGSHVDELKSNN